MVTILKEEIQNQSELLCLECENELGECECKDTGNCRCNAKPPVFLRIKYYHQTVEF